MESVGRAIANEIRQVGASRMAHPIELLAFCNDRLEADHLARQCLHQHRVRIVPLANRHGADIDDPDGRQRRQNRSDVEHPELAMSVERATVDFLGKADVLPLVAVVLRRAPGEPKSKGPPSAALLY
jgi:hypothetical protein